MKKRLLLLGGVGVGYVLGTKAGRERYDEMMRMAGRVKDDPRVRERAQQAADFAKEQAAHVRDQTDTSGSSDTPGHYPRGGPS